MSFEDNDALREKSRALLNSILAKQGEIREHLLKIKKCTNSENSKSNNVVKTVSFSDYLRESPAASTRRVIAAAYRSKSESSSPVRRRKSDTEDDDSNGDEMESEELAESSQNLAELIRFEESELLERLKMSSEDEFLRHVEAKRQSFLKRDYSGNESDSNSFRLSRKTIRKKLDDNVKKKLPRKGKRSQSAPSYLRPTEASMNMARSKSRKAEKTSEMKYNSKKADLVNKTSRRRMLKNKPLLGLDFALGTKQTKLNADIIIIN